MKWIEAMRPPPPQRDPETSYSREAAHEYGIAWEDYARHIPQVETEDCQPAVRRAFRHAVAWYLDAYHEHQDLLAGVCAVAILAYDLKDYTSAWQTAVMVEGRILNPLDPAAGARAQHILSLIFARVEEDEWATAPADPKIGRPFTWRQVFRPPRHSWGIDYAGQGIS